MSLNNNNVTTPDIISDSEVKVTYSYANASKQLRHFFAYNANLLILLQSHFPCYSDPKAVFEFGVRERDKFLDGIRCVGNEAMLLQCILDAIQGHNCSYYEAAGVSCGNSLFYSL